ncbi:MAG TPA: aspartyl protease family protein [Rhizomicrobium sp.]|nr:aspartyl protease family protein [Rhizomicrobium sp.]
MRNGILAFIGLLGLNGAAVAQTAAPAPTCAPPKVAGKPVDLGSVPGNDMVTVPVEINGTPKQFLLDINTTPDTVAQTTVAALHLPEVDQTTQSNAFADLNTSSQFRAAVVDVKGGGSAMNYQTRVRVGSFTIAGATVQNLQFLVANDREMGKSEPYDGVLTGSLFPQYDINFDFGGKQLSFLDATTCTDPNQVAYWPHQVTAVIPMSIKNARISVPVTINGHSLDAVIDIGSPRTVMRRDIAERIFGIKVDTADTPADGDAEDGMGQQIYRHVFPQISFGGVTANNVPARIQTNSMIHPIHREPTLGSRAQFAAAPADRIPDLALGMDMLHQLHLYAAFGENQLYVTPAK